MSAMKLMMARSRRAPRPPSSVKRLPASLTARSASMMPRSEPKSQWGFASMPSAAKSRGVPQRRTSGLSFSSLPTGVVSDGMFGVESQDLVQLAVHFLALRGRRGKLLVDLAHALLRGLGLVLLALAHERADLLGERVALCLQGFLFGDGGFARRVKLGETVLVPTGVARLHGGGDGILVLANETKVQHIEALLLNSWWFLVVRPVYRRSKPEAAVCRSTRKPCLRNA